MTMTEVVSAGTLYAFVDYLTKLFNPITNIVNQFSQLERSLVAGKRVFEVLDMNGEPVSQESLPRYQGNVVFEDVSFAYKNDEYVLKNYHLKQIKEKRLPCWAYGFWEKFDYELTIPFL